MGFNIGANTSIGDDGVVIPGPFSTRTNLPTGNTSTRGYLAYVSDLNELVVQTTQTVHPSAVSFPSGGSITTNSPDNGVTWYKFRVKPVDFKNEVILEQGTLAGGYTGSGVWNRIERINFSADVSNQINNMSFASRYSASHSTYLYAYYQQGSADLAGTSPGGSCKQDWSTFTVTTIPSRPNTAGFPSAYQFGPKMQNLYGFVHLNGASSYLTFSTDSWTSYTPGHPSYNSYDPISSAGCFGTSFAYYSARNTTTFKITPGTFTVTTSGAGGPPSSAVFQSMMATKWNKFYNGGGNNTTNIDLYNELADTWTNGAGRSPLGVLFEITPITGQDWGYWYAYYGVYTGACQKQLYATDTTVASSITNLQSFSGNAASGCQGPIP